ncbi:MAG: oligosaccharide flippase family protein, partial [Bacillota bacterium]
MFRNKINILKTNVFLKNIITLFSASSFAMFIPIILSPILTRMFTPEDFGLLGVYSSLVAVLSIISSMRYELSIILPESDEDGIKLFFLTIGIALFFNILLFGLILVFRNLIVDFFNVPLLYNWLLLLPISVF